MNKNNASFLMKYGSVAHLDKIIHSEIPHWDDLPASQYMPMHTKLEQAVENQNLSDAQKTKILKFPGRAPVMSRISTIMLLNHKDLSPEHVEMAVEHAKYWPDGRNAVYWHKNTTSKAMQHVVDVADSTGDFYENERFKLKRDALQKAGK